MKEDSVDNELRVHLACVWYKDFFLNLPTFVENFHPLLFITFSGFNQDVVCWL